MKSKLLTLLVFFSAWLLLTSSVSAFYNPEMGTWLNRDPIEEDGGVNLYGMCANNPVVRLDDLGKSWTDDLRDWFVDSSEYSRQMDFYTVTHVLYLSAHWRKMHESWFEENDQNPITISGISDARNKDIANNAGFKKMLGCLLTMLSSNTQPIGLDPGSIITASEKKFRWHWALLHGTSPGGWSAYTDATNFLGSYEVTLLNLSKTPDAKISTYSVRVDNISDWASATGFPGGHTSTLWLSHDRGKGIGWKRGWKSHGGSWQQHYEFEVKACPGSCKFP